MRFPPDGEATRLYLKHNLVERQLCPKSAN